MKSSRRYRTGRAAHRRSCPIESAVPLSESRPHFNAAQKSVVEEVLTSRDQVQGLQGRAGSGKTSVLATIREGAEKNGYAVEGFAPTSRAAKQLRDAGIKADTLQRFLAGGGLQAAGDPASKHLYMVDESSLASTQQMRDFLNKIGPAGQGSVDWRHPAASGRRCRKALRAVAGSGHEDRAA